jgi:glycosyltransferase involved in cell wall biosynthesis
VVVLCYRAGEAVRAIVAGIVTALTDSGVVNYELVLVGNYLEGTGDVTPQVVRDLAAHEPRIVCCATVKRGMMGWDMRSGLELATGDCLAVIDGDGQVLAADLARVYQKLRSGGFDFVKAARVHRGDGLLRKMISVVFNTLFHVLFPGLRVRDVNAKPKVMTRTAYERLALRSDDWFIDAEMMIQARRLGFKVGEVETEFLALTGRRSFINAPTIWQFLVNLCRYRFREFRERGGRRS